MSYGIKEQSNQGGLLQFTGNDELDRREREAVQEKAETTSHRQDITSLNGHIRAAFTNAVDSKQEIQDEMLRSLRQRNGIYESDITQAINRQGGTSIYMMITDVKCRALESYLKDILLPIGEKPFGMEPTPIPEIPHEIKEKARRELILEKGEKVSQAIIAEFGMDPAAMAETLTPQQKVQVEEMFNARMNEEMRAAGPEIEKELLSQMKEYAEEMAEEYATEINDQFIEGHWYNAISELIEDLATYPTAFMVGPTYRKKRVKQWTPVPGTQLSKISFVDKVVKEYDRFDPFDVYPSSTARDIQTGDLCLRLRLQRKDLDEMKGVPGYDGDAIDHVLSLYGKSGFRDFVYSDTEYADLQDRPRETQDITGWIDAVKYFGSVQGLLLRSWGMTPEQIPNPFMDYNIEAISIGNYVIMARLNRHPLGKRGIYSASFKHRNGTVWGHAPPYIIRDIQSFCNAAARAICNNFSIASGPQVWINSELVAPGTDYRELFPWKIWPFLNPKTGTAGSNFRPMDFYQPKLITKELMAAYDYFFKQAAEILGIPAYTSENLRGAGSTARGLAMLRNDAARGIRSVSRNVDMGVIVPSVEEHWLSIIMENPDQARGDVKIVARASEYLVQQEQLEMRRNEMLDRTNNPVDLQIMGMEGRRQLLKANAQALKINSDKIIPPKEDMIQNLVQAQIDQVVMTLANALNVPSQQIMSILESGTAAPEQGGQKRVGFKEPDGTAVERNLPE